MVEEIRGAWVVTKGTGGGSSVGSVSASVVRYTSEEDFSFSVLREKRKTNVARRSAFHHAAHCRVSFAARESTANRAESRVEIFRGNRSRPRGARRGVRARPSVAGRRRVPARRARRLVSVCLASAVETRAGRAASMRGRARGPSRVLGWSGSITGTDARRADAKGGTRRARGIPSGRRVAEHTHRARHVPPGRGREAET